MAFPSDVVGYLLLAAALLDGVAAPCPAGQICGANALSCGFGNTCHQCDAGRASAANQQASTGTSCPECTAGKYSNRGASSCTDCGAGKFSDSNAGDCTDCTDGRYSNSGSSTCTDCPAGRYTAVAGAIFCEGPCPEGQKTDGTSECTCDADYFSTFGCRRISCHENEFEHGDIDECLNETLGTCERCGHCMDCTTEIPTIMPGFVRFQRNEMSGGEPSTAPIATATNIVAPKAQSWTLPPLHGRKPPGRGSRSAHPRGQPSSWASERVCAEKWGFPRSTF